MSILKVLQYPDKGLKRQGALITNVHDPKIQKLIDDIIETIKSFPQCAALAATQLAIDNPPQLTVIAERENILDDSLCLINPEITAKEGIMNVQEGCMSIYPDDIVVNLERAAEVRLQSLDRYGKSFTIDAKGFLAQCIQHEVDHLQGIICIERLSKLKRDLLKKKIAKLQQANNNNKK